MLVILSPRAVTSRSVMDEVSFALDESKRVVPVLCEPCEIPFRLRRVQHVDFARDYDGALARLAPQLVSELGDLPPAAVEPPKPGPQPWHPRLSSALVWAAGGALAAALGTLLIFVNDERFTGPSAHASLPTAVAVAALMAAVFWGLAGAIGCWRRIPLLAAVVTSSAAFVVWVIVGGTYQDVLWAALVLGWPIGALVGAAAATVRSARRRAAAE
jgi:hypothetical protein